MKSNRYLMEKYYGKGLECKMFGQPISELTWEELIAVIGWLGDEMKLLRDINEKNLDFYKKAFANETSGSRRS